MLTEITIIFASFIIIWTVLENYFPTKRKPPGPLRFPIIGSAYRLISRQKIAPFIKFRNLNKQYGPITFVKMGKFDAVLIDDFNTAKALLNSETWIDRPFNTLIAKRSYGKSLGIIFASGGGWKEMRRFSSRSLKDFGFSKQTELQSIMDDQLKILLDQVEEISQSKQPILEMNHFFTLSVLNILWSMVSNVRTLRDEEKIKRLLIIVDNLTKATPIGSVLDLYPELGHMFPDLTGVTFIKKCIADLQQYFQEVLESRREQGVFTEDNRDFIDTFIKEIERHKNLSSNPNYYTDEQFITTIIDLFEAGSETSSNTLEFAIYHAMKNPSVQRKIQKEIDEVIGHSRLPTIGDKTNMPYTEAALIEVQRLANVLPITVRSSVEDCTINEFHVNKDTIGIVNIYSIHMDKTFWGDPFAFRPERFLDAKNRIISQKAARVIPFGAGKRVCIGEKMAMATLFIYFTSMLQHYNFNDVSNGQSDQLSTQEDPEEFMFKSVTNVGFTLSPYPFQARITKR